MRRSVRTNEGVRCSEHIGLGGLSWFAIRRVAGSHGGDPEVDDFGSEVRNLTKAGGDGGNPEGDDFGPEVRNLTKAGGDACGPKLRR